MSSAIVAVTGRFLVSTTENHVPASRQALIGVQPRYPEQSYLVTAQWLRDQGVKLMRKPLAVAVVKADLLLDLCPATGLHPEAESGEIEAWLRRKGLDNMLDGATRDFGVVRYFLVASLDAATDADGWANPISPAQPLLWLLGRTGVSIPRRTLVVSS